MKCETSVIDIYLTIDMIALPGCFRAWVFQICLPRGSFYLSRFFSNYRVLESLVSRTDAN